MILKLNKRSESQLMLEIRWLVGKLSEARAGSRGVEPIEVPADVLDGAHRIHLQLSSLEEVVDE